MGAYGIPGDPEGMRALARRLREEAAGMALLGARLDRTVDGMRYFAGPLARRVRGELGRWQLERMGYESGLVRMADRLVLEAARVEAEQREAEREARRKAEAMKAGRR